MNLHELALTKHVVALLVVFLNILLNVKLSNSEFNELIFIAMAAVVYGFASNVCLGISVRHGLNARHANASRRIYLGVILCFGFVIDYNRRMRWHSWLRNMIIFIVCLNNIIKNAWFRFLSFITGFLWQSYKFNLGAVKYLWLIKIITIIIAFLLFITSIMFWNLIQTL